MKIKKLSETATIPKYQTKGAAGFDLHSDTEVTIPANETRLIGTGLAFEIPEGFELQVRPRSGLSLKTGLRIANSPGTIDSDYRGEIGIIAHNNSKYPIAVQLGDRIAQGVINKVERIEFEIVNNLSESERNGNGYGSTGTNVSEEERVERKTEETGSGK